MTDLRNSLDLHATEGNVSMVDETFWHKARLIPTTGIDGAKEQEGRATSALLAVVSIVKEFGRELTKPLGAPAGRVEAYTEVQFKLGEKMVRPDGLLRVTRGKTSWVALVEVKTASNTLDAAQLGDYLDVIREHGYDALLTISNEVPPAKGQHPTTVDGRKIKKTKLAHLSWSDVLDIAKMQFEHFGVADEDQKWILEELIRYLESPKSGASDFNDMGSSWVTVREQVAAGTLRSSDKGITEVVTKFDALIYFVGLKLGQRLGRRVVQVFPKNSTNSKGDRAQVLAKSLVADGVLDAVLEVPGSATPIRVEANLKSGLVTCTYELNAPKEGKPLSRVNWLLRQIKDASPGITRIEAVAAYSKESASELLRDALEDPKKLVKDPTRDILKFRVAQSFQLGTKRSTGRGSFIDSVKSAIEDSYREIGENLRTWSAAPPKLPKGEVPVVPEGPQTIHLPAETLESRSTEADTDITD